MLTATQEIAQQKYAYRKRVFERRNLAAEHKLASMRPSTRRAFMASPSRRAFISGLGASALAIPAFAADSKLTNLPLGTIPDYFYGSQTNGSPASSNKFNALGFINVKDFGAVGDGSNDDTTAIQAAVNWTSSDQRGTIAFPTGTYKTTAPITMPMNTLYPMIRFVGLGAAQITGGFAGYLLDRNINSYQGGVWIIENLYLNNGTATTGGCIRTGASTNFAVRNCVIRADNGVLSGYSENDINTLAFDVTIDTCLLAPRASGTAQFGIVVGMNSTVRDCDVTGFGGGSAFRAFGQGWAILGGRSEVNGNGIIVGQYANGTAQASVGGSVIGHTWESNLVGLSLVSANGFFLGGSELNGFAGAGPGGADPIYGIRIASNGLLSALLTSTRVSVNAPAAWAFSMAAGGGDDKFNRCVALNSSNQAVITTGGSWQMPNNGTDMAYDNCNNGIGGQYPYMTFAQLPTSSNVYAGRVFNITDANVSGKALGDTITVGGAAGKIAVKWNGANYIWAGY